MDDLTRDDFERYLQAQKEWTDTINKINQVVPSNAVSSGNMTLNLNAGGWSVLIILVIASIVLGIAMDASLTTHSQMSDVRADMRAMQQRQDRQDDYLQAIYSVAPQLKPKGSRK